MSTNWSPMSHILAGIAEQDGPRIGRGFPSIDDHMHQENPVARQVRSALDSWD